MTETPYADRYVELMTPAFMQGIELVTITDQPLKDGILSALNEVDWDRSGLPYKEFGNDPDEIGEQYMEPDKYALTLADIAFRDAYIIIELCRDIPKQRLPEGFILKQALRASQKNLLSVALISDAEKTNIYKAIQIPEISHVYAPNLDIAEPVRVVPDDTGGHLLQWNESISACIAQLRAGEPERGCPAHRKIVTVDGYKQTLLSAFWDALVEQAHS